MTTKERIRTLKTPNGTVNRVAYCEPWNCGPCSTQRAVNRRIAHVLDAIEEINSNVIMAGKGTIENDVWGFRYDLIQKLRRDGYEIRRGQRGAIVKFTGKAES
jgi:hypothetical protein